MHRLCGAGMNYSGSSHWPQTCRSPELPGFGGHTGIIPWMTSLSFCLPSCGAITVPSRAGRRLGDDLRLEPGRVLQPCSVVVRPTHPGIALLIAGTPSVPAGRTHDLIDPRRRSDPEGKVVQSRRSWSGPEIFGDVVRVRYGPPAVHDST